jgi:hypothetical protein
MTKIQGVGRCSPIRGEVEKQPVLQIWGEEVPPVKILRRDDGIGEEGVRVERKVIGVLFHPDPSLYSQNRIGTQSPG